MSRFSSFCTLGALFVSASVVQSHAFAAPAKRTLSGYMPAATRAFRAMGLIKNAPVVRARVLAPVAPRKGTRSGRVAAADGPLSFKFEGYTKAHQDILLAFMRRNYPTMVQRYGAPSPEQRANGGKIIKVIGNDSEADFEGTPEEVANRSAGVVGYQPLLDPDNSSDPDNSVRRDGGTIYFPYQNRFSAEVNQFNFTRLVLRAFQGPNNFSYNFDAGVYNDVYQAGMADAAALLVLYDSLSAADKAKFDPSNYYVYVLHIYDLLNRPELSTAYILPALDDPSPDENSLLPEFRLDMAQAAWLKVAVENPTFFRDFNAAYYQQVPARQAATSSQLRAIAAQVAPQVEGLSFQDWARRQYILDNTITTGTKILPLVEPLATPAGAGEISGFQGYAEAFTTGADGRDTRITGFGTIDAFDENGVNINAQSPELRDLNLFELKAIPSPKSVDFSAGFNALPASDRARITLRFKFRGAQTTAFYPYVGTGGAASQTTIRGVTTLGTGGALSLSNASGSESLSVARGAFAGTKKYPSAPSVITTLTLGGRTFKRNTAWLPAGARGVEFVLDGGANNSTFTLKTSPGASRVRMISLPVFPAQSDEAAILGFAAKDLKLARYRPNLAPATVADKNLTFGINGDRHEIYPYISAPIAPGRGYWLGAGEITRTIQGSEPRADQLYEVPLPGGWNQIGVPFNKAFSPDAIQVRYGSFAAVSYADAVKNGLLAPGIWRWRGEGGYARADGVAGATLPPFEGFYIYVIPARGVSLFFNPAAATVTSARQKSGWRVPLVASTEAASDSSNSFGVAGAGESAPAGAMRLAAAKPPTGPQAVTLHFASSGDAEADRSGAGAASGWADSFLASLSRGGEGKWEFAVEGTAKGESVTLSWGDLGELPQTTKLRLRDEKTGQSVALRAGGRYGWIGDGAARRFSILASPSARASLQIAAAPSRGVEVGVAVTPAARGRLEIQTLTGDTVWVLKSGEFGVKAEKFAWSGAQTSGKPALRGRYRAIWVPATEGDRGAARDFGWTP